MRRLLVVLTLVFATPANAQQAAGQGRTVPAKVIADIAEVRAGPGAAYVSRGRIYAGDSLSVKRRSDNGEWYEITGAGVSGWVRARALDVQRVTAAPTNPGRDRKTTNYTYDAPGRRRALGGARAGSGEGTEGAVPAPRRRRPPPGEGTLRLRVSLGAAQIRRDFDSNIAIESALRDLGASATGFGYELEVEHLAHRHISLRALYRDTRFTSIEIPASAAFGFDAPVEIATSAQQVELDATGRYPIGGGWLGAYAGGHLLRHHYQETQPYAVLLSNSFYAFTGGPAAGWRFGRIELGARGGLLLPLSVSQSPAQSGDPSGSGVTATARLTWHIAQRFAVVAHWHLLRQEVEFEGESTHVDTHGAAPEGYDAAREVDSVHGGGLGVRWTPM